MGEISSPAAALSTRACVIWLALSAPRMAVTARAAASRLRASQSQALAGSVRPRRARAPRVDWVGAEAIPPARAGLEGGGGQWGRRSAGGGADAAAGGAGGGRPG